MGPGLGEDEGRLAIVDREAPGKLGHEQFAVLPRPFGWGGLHARRPRLWSSWCPKGRRLREPQCTRLPGSISLRGRSLISPPDAFLMSPGGWIPLLIAV